MTALLFYLLKVSGCLTIIYLFYLLLLRNITLFRFNRFNLVFGLILSFIVPLIGTPSPGLSTAINDAVGIQYFDLTSDRNVLRQQVEATTQVFISRAAIPGMVYLAGTAVALFFLMHSLFRTINLLRKSQLSSYNGIKIARTDFIAPFSFFGIIFLPYNNPSSLIIDHEITHIRQMHWIDLFLIELTSIILWFNPIVYFYRKSIVMQHEYLADESVLRSTTEENYLHCLLDQLQLTNNLRFTNNFQSNSIKQRIVMMTRKRTQSRIRCLIMIPAICLLFLGFSKTEEPMTVSDTFQDGPAATPVDLSKVTHPVSGFGMRMHPILHKEVFHSGMDFVLDTGENVKAAMSGTVVKVHNDTDAWGNYVVVKHNDTYSTSYSHLQSFVVKEGDQVSTGQLIGYVGSTGLSVGPHLHYEVIKDGQQVDPALYLPK